MRGSVRAVRLGLRWRILVLVLVTSLAYAGESLAGKSGSTCGGDCNENGTVVVGELIRGIGVGLGVRPMDECPAVDEDGSGVVEIGELVLAVHHALEGCPTEGAVFTIRACATAEDPDGQTFRVLIREPAVINEAESLIGVGPGRILSGNLRAGDGDFNAPWSWHHDPETVGFSDLTIELCDGCPQFVEDDLDYWLDVVGQYCPWSTEVVARER